MTSTELEEEVDVADTAVEGVVAEPTLLVQREAEGELTRLVE